MDNLFITQKNTKTNNFKGKGKNAPYRANTVMKVGGRKVALSPNNNIKYDFPVTITYKEPGAGIK